MAAHGLAQGELDPAVDRILGIEGGATKTTWCLVNADGSVHADGLAGCGNAAMLGDDDLRQLFRSISQALPSQPTSIGAGMAGVVTPALRARVAARLKEIFPGAQTVVVDHDAASGFLAAHPSGTGILVIAGTGSFVLGGRDGRRARSGGWGHVAGDAGSAYHLAECGLRSVFASYDETGDVPALGVALLADTCMNSLESLCAWVTQNAGSKRTIAGLARTVVHAAEGGCPLALACVAECAGSLARGVANVARRLEMPRPVVALSGGLLLNAALYRETFSRLLAERLSPSEIRISTTPGALGAARLVGAAATSPPRPADAACGKPADEVRRSNTEKRNPRTRHLDTRTVPDLVELFLDETARIVPALRTVAPRLAQAVEVIVTALQGGGRLFYIGAGTSGRLGVLDASEIPPTFGAATTLVQGIMAGGLQALTQGVEEIEDDRAAGEEAVRQRGAVAGDVVVGIAASGRTPFVLAALAEARQRGARTVFLTCNPQRPELSTPVDVAVDIPTEPEFVTGSTRLAAGTATKIALNLLSTLAMIRLGKVRDNLMIDVRATNEKLRDRAVRIVVELTGWDEERAGATLAHRNWDVRRVIDGQSPTQSPDSAK